MNREKGEQEKCEEGRIAAAESHQGIYSQLGDITNRVQDASNEKVEWRALQDQQWAEKTRAPGPENDTSTVARGDDR